MYEHVLLPVNTSESADAAAEHAFDLAGRYGATLHVVHATDAMNATVTGLGDEVLDTLERDARSAVEEVARRASDRGLDVVDSIVQGAPHEAITEYVHDRGIDLVVMATHDRAGLDRHLLGSTTDRVVRNRLGARTRGHASRVNRVRSPGSTDRRGSAASAPRVAPGRETRTPSAR